VQSNLHLQLSNLATSERKKAAADAFNVRLRTLNRRVQGISAQRDCTPNNQKLTATEEKTIIGYILDLNS
jgi:hypothetical protein